MLSKPSHLADKVITYSNADLKILLLNDLKKIDRITNPIVTTTFTTWYNFYAKTKV